MEEFKALKTYLKREYACHDERSDLYAYFIERGHHLLRRGGRFGMIVSNKFLRANYGKPLRDFLFQKTTITRIADFAGLPVFAGATVRTLILLTKAEKNSKTSLKYSPPPSSEVFQTLAGRSVTVDEATEGAAFEILPSALQKPIWNFAERHVDELMAKLQDGFVPLVKYCEGQICMGIKSGYTEAFVLDSKTRESILKHNRKAGEVVKPFVNGRNIRRYFIDDPKLSLIYTFHGIQMRDYPAVMEHLRPFKQRLLSRATKQEWYELQQPQFNFSKWMGSPKIIFPDIATAPRFTLDETGYYGSNTTYFIPRRDLYLLGLLNSKLGSFYFVKTCAGLEGKNETYLRFFGQYLEGFPVRTIDFSDKADKSRHDRMVSLAEQMLDLHRRQAAAKTPAEQTALARQIAATDAQIDRLVYELYGLTEQEIGIVEGAA